MAKPTCSNAISDKLFSLHLKDGFRAEQYFAWAVDDYLADLIQQKKQNPPPEVVMPALFDLGRLYAGEVINNEPFSDVLGRTYMDLVSQGGQKMLAQYFTPEPVAYLMAQLTSPESISNGAGELYRVCEPSCGAGVMLLQFCRVVTEQKGYDVLKGISLSAIDLDQMCAKICAVQLLANAMIHGFSYGELLVMHGNSLGDPQKLTAIVHALHADQRARVLPALHPARVAQMRDVIAAQPDLKKRHEEQLELF